MTADQTHDILRKIVAAKAGATSVVAGGGHSAHEERLAEALELLVQSLNNDSD